jgi:hypothetical protein
MGESRIVQNQHSPNSQFSILNSQFLIVTNGITKRNPGSHRFGRLDTENHECDEDGVGSQAEED